MTITAKNYAAQAQAGLKLWADATAHLYSKDAKAVRELSASIGDAVHFALPDNGRIMEDGLKGLQGIDLRLPYPAITVEYFVNEKAPWNPETEVSSPKRLAFAYEIPQGMFDDVSEFSEGGVIVFAANFISRENGTGGYWGPIPMGLAIPRRWEGRAWLGVQPSIAPAESGTVFTCIDVPLCHEIYEQMVDAYGEESAALYAHHDIQDEATAVLELCEALACSNIESEVIEPVDQRKNAKRIKQGKLPRYETRRLVIKAPITRGAESQAQGGSDRQGPREHLRRGHIRRLQDGRRIWVQSCVVGSRENGVIHKSYAVVGAKETA